MPRSREAISTIKGYYFQFDYYILQLLCLQSDDAFCPYIYLHGLSDTRLSNVKKLLTENDYCIWDGYEYKDATFNPSALSRPINAFLGVRAKIINKKCEIDVVLAECKGSKEVYQFFLQKPFYEREKYVGRNFQILRTEDVTKMI